MEVQNSSYWFFRTRQSISAGVVLVGAGHHLDLGETNIKLGTVANTTGSYNLSSKTVLITKHPGDSRRANVLNAIARVSYEHMYLEQEMGLSKQREDQTIFLYQAMRAIAFSRMLAQERNKNIAEEIRQLCLPHKNFLDFGSYYRWLSSQPSTGYGKEQSFKGDNVPIGFVRWLSIVVPSQVCDGMDRVRRIKPRLLANRIKNSGLVKPNTSYSVGSRTFRESGVSDVSINDPSALITMQALIGSTPKDV